jgi:hypothetical protein
MCVWRYFGILKEKNLLKKLSFLLLAEIYFVGPTAHKFCRAKGFGPTKLRANFELGRTKFVGPIW